MNLFLGQTFLKANFFKPAYLHGAGVTPPEQDGRSGYWRLFFTQMQEEALKQYDKKKAELGEALPVALKEVVEKAQPKVAPKKRVEPKPEPLFQPELELPKLKPIYRPPQAAPMPDQFPAFMLLASVEVRQWYLDFQPHLIKMLENQVKIKQQIAANDADIRLRLLLLLAA